MDVSDILFWLQLAEYLAIFYYMVPVAYSAKTLNGNLIFYFMPRCTGQPMGHHVGPTRWPVR